MDDKARLQEIKRKAMTFNQELREIDLEEHIDWLIEQAEKVERLEKENEIFRLRSQRRGERIAYLEDQLGKEMSHSIKISQELNSVKKQLQQAQTKAERYEKALREIANEQEVGEGDFNADDVANNLIAAAKEALENKFL
jgi:succinate dehydrogenase/fumarate reductase flavoprotein subunit